MSDNLKLASLELAGLISGKSNNHNRINELKSILTYHPGQPSGNGVKDDVERIGIYKATMINGEKHFERDIEAQHYFGIWPKVNTIPPKKKGKHRIVMFGESVARGLFYEPYYAPPVILEEILKKCHSEDTEVIDLAVSSVGPDQILDLCKRAFGLEPDTYVIFAGNNWKGIGVTEEDLDAIMASIGSGKINYEKIKQILGNAVQHFADEFFSKLNALTSGKKIDLLFIIPEYNLMDYKTSVVQKDVSFVDVNTHEWLEVKTKTEKAFEEGDLEKVKMLSEKLLSLNPLHSLAYEWLAYCSLKEGKNDEAREFLEQARNNTMFSLKRTTPGINNVTRKAIIASAAKYNFPTLCLKEVFSEHLKGNLPGRELFLDYCHLTTEGIKISMSKAADRLVQIWTGKNISPEALRDYKISADPAILAAAHFCAALHNAHWGQGHEIINHHCRQALDSHGETIKAMTSYLDMISRKAPWLVNKETHYLKNSNFGKQIAGGINIEMESFKFNDIVFVESILQAMKEKGIHLSEKIEDLRQSEYAIGTSKVDLLQTYYLPSTFDSLVSFNYRETSFYVENGSRSNFHFVTSDKLPIEIDLTYRTPNPAKADEKIEVYVNDDLFTALPQEKNWKSISLKIPQKYFKKGMNNLRIHWPVPLTNDVVHTEDKMKDLILALTPSWGEIHTFYCRQLLN
jgi:tetratricopeptide (TPR) repeat protein